VPNAMIKILFSIFIVLRYLGPKLNSTVLRSTFLRYACSHFIRKLTVIMKFVERLKLIRQVGEGNPTVRMVPSPTY
jgi:hypothetical protein